MKLMLDSVYEDIQRGECQMLIIYILIFSRIYFRFFLSRGWISDADWKNWVSDRLLLPRVFSRTHIL